MSSPTSPKPASGAPGVKMLITASALVATLGGWAALANTQSSTVSTGINQLAPDGLALNWPPLPTLVAPAGVHAAIDQSAGHTPVLRAVPSLPPITITRSSR